jgi:hypothetical protein
MPDGGAAAHRHADDACARRRSRRRRAMLHYAILFLSRTRVGHARASSRADATGDEGGDASHFRPHGNVCTLTRRRKPVPRLGKKKTDTAGGRLTVPGTALAHRAGARQSAIKAEIEAFKSALVYL